MKSIKAPTGTTLDATIVSKNIEVYGITEDGTLVSVSDASSILGEPIYIPGCAVLTWDDFASPNCTLGCAKTPVPTEYKENITRLAISVEAVATRCGSVPSILLGWTTQSHAEHVTGYSSQVMISPHTLGLAVDVVFNGTSPVIAANTASELSALSAAGNAAVGFKNIFVFPGYVHLELFESADVFGKAAVIHKPDPEVLQYGTGKEGINSYLFAARETSLLVDVVGHDDTQVVLPDARFETIGSLADFIKISSTSLAQTHGILVYEDNTVDWLINWTVVRQPVSQATILGLNKRDANGNIFVPKNSVGTMNASLGLFSQTIQNAEGIIFLLKEEYDTATSQLT